MDLLPRSHLDFSKKSYWEEFFKKRNRKAFEWYGSYNQLCGILHKYIKPKDSVLVVGCGNSSLSADLYDVGYRKLTNIDISEVVIRQMTEKNARDRPEMTFQVMDALKMDFADEAFTCAVDKGTLDALMPDNTPETQERAGQMFQEIGRVLRVGGRYVCFSLLQDHIMNRLLDWFPSQWWMLRVCRCPDVLETDQCGEEDSGPELPVFAIVCTKFKKMENFTPVLEVSLQESSVTRVSSPLEVVSWVQSLQQYSIVQHEMSHQTSAGTSSKVTTEVTQVDLMSTRKGTESVRYSLYVLDTFHSASQDKDKRFAIFVVPQGRECEWMFASTQGRIQLTESVGFGRLVVAHLHRGQDYQNMEVVKRELSEKVMDLAPPGLSPRVTVPIFSLGEDTGQRQILFEGNSPVSGPLVVEDVTTPLGTVRRLVFLSRRTLVQSEAKVIGRRGNKSHAGNNSPAQVAPVDNSRLSCDHHALMLAAMARLKPIGSSARMLLLGLGAGSLCSFLCRYFPQLQITAVDIDPMMPTIAKEYFNLPASSQLEIIIDDGLKVLKNAANEGMQYDLVLFDMDNKDPSLGISCPSPEFVESHCFNTVKKCLSSKGLFVLNLVCREKSIRDSVLQRLKCTFDSINAYKLPEEVNEIFHCCNSGDPDPGSFKKNLESLNRYVSRKQKQHKIEFLDVEKTMEMMKLI